MTLRLFPKEFFCCHLYSQIIISELKVSNAANMYIDNSKERVTFKDLQKLVEQSSQSNLEQAQLFEILCID